MRLHIHPRHAPAGRRATAAGRVRGGARGLALALGLALLAAGGGARADTPGAFDYYILALSWSPGWCASEDSGEADRDRAAQCAPGAGRGFVVHGLWPQYERGWPADCPARFRDPTRRETAAMADIMASAGLAWHQWRKHGRCAGLPPDAYFATLRRAAGGVAIPPAFARLPRDLALPATAVEDAFMAVNPGLTRDGITVACDGGQRLREVRLCLTRDLAPRPCAADARRDCRADALRMERVR